MNAIKTTILALAMVFVPAAGYCDTPEKPAGADTKSLLNAYSSFADEYFGSVLTGLRLVAATKEAKGGKWEDIKGLLDELNRDEPGAAAFWYAIPDGNYYTVEKGPTGEKLSDRPYFPSLISGNEVKGHLVISRSTGKRAAIFAVPVKSGDKVTGALGASLSVDEVSRRMDSRMGLPTGVIFYALDNEGRVSLHWKPELLFEYPSDLGSETLNYAIAKMMSEPEGVVNYEFQGSKVVYFKKSPLTGWVYALGVVTGQPEKK